MFDWLRRKNEIEERKTSATCPVCKKGKLIEQRYKETVSRYCDSCGEEFEEPLDIIADITGNAAGKRGR